MSLLFKTLCLIASLISFNQARAEALYFYHNDHLGTPQLLTDSEQNVVWQADYDAFGQAKITLEHVEQNLRFPGQYHDAETGLHYNYYRDYDPQTGRYLQSDPIGLAGGINTYAYVGGNPLGYSDPTGLAAETLLDAAALALSAHDFQQCPSFSNGLWLLADVISTTIPGLPAIGIARHVDRLGDVGKGVGWKSDPYHPDWKKELGPKPVGSDVAKEPTPSTNPDLFRNMRGCKGKCNTQTGEIWEPDMLHKDHFEVYKNRKNYDKGKRDRSVWDDGRPKDNF